MNKFHRDDIETIIARKRPGRPLQNVPRLMIQPPDYDSNSDDDSNNNLEICPECPVCPVCPVCL